MSSNAPIPRGPAFLSYSFNWCLATVFLLATSRGSHAVDFVRGDVNTDGRISLSDSLMLRRFVFDQGPTPTCLDAADTNDDGHVDLTDVLYLISRLFGIEFPVFPVPPELDLEIGPDPTEDDLTCEMYDVVEPEQTSDVIRLGDVEGIPGEEVDIPVYVSNTRAIEAFQLVMRYDQGVFEVNFDNGGQSAISFKGGFYEERYSEDLKPGFRSVQRLAEDTLVLGFVPSIFPLGLETPPGQDRLVFNIRGSIGENAEPGTLVSLVLSNGEDGEENGRFMLRNELTHDGEARLISSMPRRVPGELKVIPDLILFTRGDANRDLEVDQSDAIFILGYLFLGDDAPLCPDAADANDDGTIDISDAISILGTVFGGSKLIAVPYPRRGTDPSLDSLGTCRS